MKLLEENNKAPTRDGSMSLGPSEQWLGLQRDVRAKSRVRREMEPKAERQWKSKAKELEERQA